MYYLRYGNERGRADFGWLKSKHSFSFGNYFDPKHMGFSALRVINDDTVQGGAGFDTHGHRDMEIISYVLEGSIEHKDSMGQQYIVPAGDIQRMSAGTGVTHSEFNHSQNKPLRFLQIWIQPNKKGVAPSYEQKSVEQRGPLTPLVTADGREGSLSMHQDASLYRLQLKQGDEFQLDTQQRPGYLHVIEGQLEANGHPLAAGDALGAYQESLNISAQTDLTALWFDLPAIKAS
ncbi:pirin family protein [Parahaliea sp. F7430]|uniref:Pirin family protein n=1 Tax=Sediminihaliea albiluteola TaxID=2758564 RepID=A0A7W2TX39_9GAMM|nr:pirin family protein [Sediminihaliea albiluteola]MBA6413429.1 pirin family protein [Sediminihaliea albiluteola]